MSETATQQYSWFHHAGYVVPSIRASVPEFCSALFLEWDGRVVHDPLQMVSVTFLATSDTSATTVELVEPAGPRSPVLPFLAANPKGGLHHVCYEVADLARQLAQAKAVGHTLVRVPMPAAAFGGRRIAWIRTESGALIEYLQR